MRGDCVSDARDDAYSAFKELTKFLDGRAIGFDEMFRSLGSRVTENRTSYPPYNIVKHSEDTFSIELAVAGFGKNNLEIEMANNTLVVKGGLTVEDMSNETVNPVQYLWKGIADRYFTRNFTLADTVEVKNAELINGMLKIFLENVIPEEKKPKVIDIK